MGALRKAFPQFPSCSLAEPSPARHGLLLPFFPPLNVPLKVYVQSSRYHVDVETGLPPLLCDAEKIPRCSYFRLLVSLLERCLILYLYLLSLHPTCSSPLGEKAIKSSSVSCVLVASDVRLEFKFRKQGSRQICLYCVSAHLYFVLEWRSFRS